MTNVFIDGLAIGRKRYSNTLPVVRSDNWHGLVVSIEIDRGDKKSGVDEDGIPWSHVYDVPYGELPSTCALSDGDPVDVYLGDAKDASMVYVVHQLRKDGSYDEDKCMLNFANVEEAVDAYKRHGPPFGFGSVEAMTVDQFMKGYLASNRRHA